MPAERRSFTAARPVKTERTHEENQERAYIAASRRSDRSLEARIESARRASEIHKKRTGRALRVTEQDVINEEMYEEEDDDLPTQYQRLNAHLHTTSVMFNKKLHDYIATQHGVRNMFMSQYQNQQFSQLGGQYPPPNNGSLPQTNNWLNPTTMPPQQFNQQPTNNNTNQQPQPSHVNTSVRSSPYHIPQRPQPHQRSASIAVPAFDSSMQQGTVTPQDARRMSLPAQAGVDGQSRPALSRGSSFQPTSPTTDTSASPRSGSGQHTPHLQVDTDTPASAPFGAMNFPMGSQMLGGPNPLSMSLPPESQQFVGSILDPTDPRTAMFMSGSEHLAQPFTPTYTYNPNYSPKALKSGGSMTLSMPQSAIKSEAGTDSFAPISSGLYTNDSFLTPGNEGYSAFFDFQSSDFAQSTDEQNNNEQLVDGSSFVNWD
ncbi:uncharacterized protein EKO05_0009471 [Ascochyta rabiei]|uniref:Uncharacterized protein n=1 Tax=Didymella rabiei TaxID=5454 RepID=A0A163GRH9_DIDRA|nr:uncharacterized protein EKO05_0009471 [Ascochyta rabiei]KZM24978.1 hypothetical protein ST47_g3862 [Ascochyta rabiei]UPX19202.1 hypothetical protein EKO05_0009471 [Ascochyta rabiei]